MAYEFTFSSPKVLVHFAAHLCCDMLLINPDSTQHKFTASNFSMFLMDSGQTTIDACTVVFVIRCAKR